MTISNDATSEAPAFRANVFVRHWRGELPLWVSYWVIGFGGTFIARLAILAIETWSPLIPLRADHALAVVFIASWSLTLAITVWQVVGTWRAATRYIGARRAAGKRGAWGILAKAVLVVSSIATGATIVRTAVPEAVEAYEIAVLGDPDVPAFGIRVMRGGSEAEYFGGIRIGATDALRAVLDRNPGIQVLHINSGGGRFIEAERMAAVVRARGLATYVSGNCESACTLVFPAGRNRWLAPEAKLGFHTPDFGLFDGRAQTRGLNQWRDALIAAGYRPDFVDRGLAVPFNEMWYPTHEELAQSGLSFQVADGSQFAVSGYGGAVSREDFDALGDDIPAYAALRDRMPAAFDTAADTLVAAFDAGRTDRQLLGVLRAAIGPALVAAAPDATPRALLDYSLTSTAILTEIRGVSSGLCYLAATGGAFDVAGTRYVEDDTRAVEWAVIEQVLATAAPQPAIPAATLAAAVERLEAGLAESLDTRDRALLSAPAAPADLEDDYCAAVIVLGRVIGGLPQDDAVVILRQLALSRRQGTVDPGLPAIVRRHFLVQ